MSVLYWYSWFTLIGAVFALNNIKEYTDESQFPTRLKIVFDVYLPSNVNINLWSKTRVKKMGRIKSFTKLQDYLLTKQMLIRCSFSLINARFYINPLGFNAYRILWLSIISYALSYLVKQCTIISCAFLTRWLIRFGVLY